MARLRRPVLFSEHFHVDAQHLAREGAFDPVLNFDTPLFIDPTLLEDNPVGQMRRAWTRYTRWFSELGELLARSRSAGDIPWNRALALLHFPEPLATCLGHTVEGIEGTGVGDKLASLLLHAAYRMVHSEPDDKWIRCLPFLYRGFGPDRISDMATHVILPDLAEYTRTVLEGLTLPRIRKRIDCENYELPVYNDRPVLLVPLRVLSEIPAAHDIGHLADAVQHNHDLRRRVIERLEGMVRVGANGWLNELIDLAVEGKGGALDAFSDLLLAARAPYDTDSDPGGHIAWRRCLTVAARFTLELRDSDPPDQKARAIVGQFATLLHEPDVSRLLYRGTNAVDPRPIGALRLLFFAIATSYCSGRDDIAVDYDTGSGLTTFWSMDKAVLCVDVASSVQSTLQIRYERGSHTGRLFVLVDFANEEAVAKVIDRMNALRSRGEPASEVNVIEV